MSEKITRRRKRFDMAASVVAAVIMTLALMGSGTPASAQTTVPVTNTGDPTGAGGCTLRDAINISKGGSAAAGDTCISTGSGTPYTIVFTVTGTITLGSELPGVIGNLTIVGPSVSPGITIDGGGNINDRLMQVAAGATLNLQFLTMAHGHSEDIFNGGGGVFNEGALTVTNCTFSGNTADPGIGAGISNTGTLTVANSTFSGNSAGLSGDGGGAIINAGNVTVTDSTFSGNSATNSGGAIFNTGNVTVTNSTFSGNRALNEGIGGGIFEAIGATGTVTLKGSVLVNETTRNCFGGIIDAGYNISDDSSCGFARTGSGTTVTASRRSSTARVLRTTGE